MGKRATKVYCAGPLFNNKEREEMQALADLLEEAGYRTFLPQRDGLEFTVCVKALTARGVDIGMAGSILSRAIFALDVYQVIEECDAIVVNLNGRVPDEGAVSEAAIAWCSGKALVGYKADGRSVFHGQDNPLVAGLFNFDICDSLEGIPEAMGHVLAQNRTRESRSALRRVQLQSYLALGQRLTEALQRPDKIASVTRVMVEEAARKDQPSPPVPQPAER
jgi:nucleoside 2-deoxyribosyltransferase